MLGVLCRLMRDVGVSEEEAHAAVEQSYGFFKKTPKHRADLAAEFGKALQEMADDASDQD